MELHALQVFATVVSERSFSRAAEKLFRTQPAISLAVQRLESELGEKLIDRGAKELVLTDAGSTVLDFARRFATCEEELEGALAELRDKSAGRLIIGANESSTLYLLPLHPALPAPVSRRSRCRCGAASRATSRSSCWTAISSSAWPATIPATIVWSPRSSTPTRWRSSCRRSTASPAAGRSRSPSSARRPSSPTTSCRPTARSCCASSAGTRCR